MKTRLVENQPQHAQNKRDLIFCPRMTHQKLFGR